MQNVTDIDDPLFERAAATGEDWADLGARETELFREDMAALRILPPDAYVGRWRRSRSILELIGRLEERGAVYPLDGDLYFSVRAAEGFGNGERPRSRGHARAVRRARGRPRPYRASATRSTACSGSPSGRMSRRGTRRGGAAAPAGTSSARQSRRPTSARPSTSRAAVETSSSRTTRCPPRMAKPRPASRSPGPTSTRAWSGSTARRCRSPRATSSSYQRCASQAPTRWRSGWVCSRTTCARTGSGHRCNSPRPRSGSSAGASRRAPALGATPDFRLGRVGAGAHRRPGRRRRQPRRATRAGRPRRVGRARDRDPGCSARGCRCRRGVRRAARRGSPAGTLLHLIVLVVHRSVDQVELLSSKRQVRHLTTGVASPRCGELTLVLLERHVPQLPPAQPLVWSYSR